MFKTSLIALTIPLDFLTQYFMFSSMDLSMRCQNHLYHFTPRMSISIRFHKLSNKNPYYTGKKSDMKRNQFLQKVPQSQISPLEIRYFID